MNRTGMSRRLSERAEPWDIVVVGGGATGAGIALDAATRGYAVALLERGDFGQGTSSRSTKLIHGGVRYLQQGNLALVREALAERAILLRMAPTLVHPLDLVVPAYAWWEKTYYGTGLWMYDRLAGARGLAPSRRLDGRETLALLPGIRTAGLRGGVVYQDGQFDDARLLLAVLREAARAGAAVLNHAPVTGLVKQDGRLTGVRARDAVGGEEFEVRARVVVNATGPFCDRLLRMDREDSAVAVRPSQGTHIVLPLSFLGGRAGMLIPRTPDGRLLFLIPWKEHLLCGTTDQALASVPDEPEPGGEEIDFLLETAGRFLERRPARADVLAAFSGVRPLVAAGAGATSGLSREHRVWFSESGMMSVVGGKWTTFRRMAQDALNRIERSRGWPARPCVTATLVLAADEPPSGVGERLHPAFPDTGEEVRWLIRETMPRTVDDVLERRMRAGLLDPAAAAALRPRVEAMLSEAGADGSGG